MARYKTKLEKSQKYKKSKSHIWKYVTYVWKTRDTWNRVVYYVWKIIWETESTYDIKFKDQYIYNEYKEPFIKYWIPKNSVTLYQEIDKDFNL